mgnify:CR=1 FL=1
MKRILITGGAGFIGSHTCLTLLENGYELYVLDSFINSSPQSLKRIEHILKDKNIDIDNKLHVYKGDIRDEERLNKIFLEATKSGDPIQGVIHFAGLKAVKESVENPLLYWDSNVNGAISLFKAMEKNNCKIMVFSSSATIYGLASDKPLNENSKISPINPYGSTKVAIENISNDIFNNSKNDWRIVNLRYFNPIGAHSSGLIGENPLGSPNNIFPIILNVAMGREKILKVFGNNWPTYDGSCVRDYIHVMDLAEGHIKALEYLLENKPQILNLNLGTGIGTSVLDLIKSFEIVNKLSIPYIFSEPRKGDASCVVADNTLAKKRLDWVPNRTIEDACLDGWNWRSKNPNGFN